MSVTSDLNLNMIVLKEKKKLMPIIEDFLHKKPQTAPKQKKTKSMEPDWSSNPDNWTFVFSKSLPTSLKGNSYPLVARVAPIVEL